MTVLKGSTEQNSYQLPDIPTDKLVERIAANDKRAEKVLFERYWQGLQFILSRRINDRHLVEDLAQETIFLVLRKAREGQIYNPKALNGFVRQTAINLMIAYQRKEKRHATSNDEHIEHYPCKARDDLSHHQYCHRTLEIVAQIIDELNSQRDKDILRMYYLDEKDKHKICEQLQLTATHFDRVLFRARSRLKLLLKNKLTPQVKKHSIFKLFVVSVLSVLPLCKGEPIAAIHSVGESGICQHYVTKTITSFCVAK